MCFHFHENEYEYLWFVAKEKIQMINMYNMRYSLLKTRPSKFFIMLIKNPTFVRFY